MRLAWMAAGAALLAGCAAVTNDWSGVHPAEAKPDDSSAQAAAEAAIRSTLKDPDSGTFANWSPVFKTYTGMSMTTPVWAICADVNAKNSYGGMAGVKTMIVELAQPPVVREMGYGCEIAKDAARQAP